MKLSIVINGMDIERYFLMDVILRDRGFDGDRTDQLVVRINAVYYVTCLLTVRVYASKLAIPVGEVDSYKRGTLVFSEDYSFKSVDRFLGIPKYRCVTGFSPFDVSDAPLLVNWGWMSQTF